MVRLMAQNVISFSVSAAVCVKTETAVSILGSAKAGTLTVSSAREKTTWRGMLVSTCKCYCAHLLTRVEVCEVDRMSVVGIGVAFCTASLSTLGISESAQQPKVR